MTPIARARAFGALAGALIALSAFAAPSLGAEALRGQAGTVVTAPTPVLHRHHHHRHRLHGFHRFGFHPHGLHRRGLHGFFGHRRHFGLHGGFGFLRHRRGCDAVSKRGHWNGRPALL